jgi:outer membrane immunogenic protein
MRLLVIAGLALALSAAGALAADPPELIIEDSGAHDWAGLYVGAYGLGGFGVVTDDYDLVTPFTFEIMGLGAGAQVGANAQMGNLVVGLRGEAAGIVVITGTGLCDGGTVPACGGSGTDPTVTVDSLASVNAVLGLAMDSWLLYGTAGIGVAHAVASDTFQGGTDNHWHRGVVVSAGVEAMVADNLSVFGEVGFGWYEGIDYALVSTPDNIGFNIATAKAGVNIHF